MTEDQPLDIVTLHLTPKFDPDLYLCLSQLGRLEAEAVGLLGEAWTRWLPELRCVHLRDGASGYLLVYLGKPVEFETERFWDESPANGWMLHNLAVTMLYSAIRQAVPEVADRGCAPVPEADARIPAAVTALGLSMTAGGILSRKYSALTAMPFAGGCRVCALRESCPRGCPIDTARTEES